jgi:aryl-alcohol dehydrogenase-like predicted oxidoreductase
MSKSPGRRWPKADWPANRPKERRKLFALRPMPSAGACTCKRTYIAQRVGDVAKARGLPMAQVALACILGKPAVTAPIVGATKPHHLDDAVAALSVCLTADEINHLEEAYQPGEAERAGLEAAGSEPAAGETASHRGSR